jgi:hypothetical protein
MDDLDNLRSLTRTQPIIDHHANNLLKRESALESSSYPLQAITCADYRLTEDNGKHTLPLWRAIGQLGELYGSPCGSWDEVQAAHDRWVREDYVGLIQKSLKGTHVLFLDDLTREEREDVESLSGHDSFTASPTKRIVHIEALAEAEILEIARSERRPDETIWNNFRQRFQNALAEAMEDSNVVAFQTDVCHRTGLDVDPYSSDDTTLGGSLLRILDSGTTRSGFQVEDKPLCDWLVQQTLKVITSRRAHVVKPLQFETGLLRSYGTKETSLVRVNPAFLQPLIDQYSHAAIVLLHTAYPYTREAGYLASLYPNIYLDLGRVFPTVSREGQEKVLRQCLEVTPTTRLLWSTGGCEHPESYWLATYQFRQALEKVS